MATYSELFKPKKTVKYAIAVTRDGEYWYDLGQYNSPKLCVAALKKMPFPPNWNDFKEIKILQIGIIEQVADVTPKDLSVYGIHKSKS